MPTTRHHPGGILSFSGLPMPQETTQSYGSGLKKGHRQATPCPYPRRSLTPPSSNLRLLPSLIFLTSRDTNPTIPPLTEAPIRVQGGEAAIVAVTIDVRDRAPPPPPGQGGRD